MLDSRLALPVNTVLNGSYRILRVVGSGGFGITYEAEDKALGAVVGIKEYYPVACADRDNTMRVRPSSEHSRRAFDWGRANFLQEARTWPASIIRASCASRACSRPTPPLTW